MAKVDSGEIVQIYVVQALHLLSHLTPVAIFWTVLAGLLNSLL